MNFLQKLFGKNLNTNINDKKSNQEKDNTKNDKDWLALLNALAECQNSQKMDELVDEIVRIGNRNAVPKLVSFMIASYENGIKRNEKLKAVSMDTSSLLLSRIPSEILPSEIKKQREEMSSSFARGHKALHALIGLRAIDELQAILDNPVYNHLNEDNFRSAIRQINEAIAKESSETSEYNLNNKLDTQKSVGVNVRESEIKDRLKVIRSKFSILGNAYVASNIRTGPKEMAEIEKVLSDILAEGDIGLFFLLERIMEGVTYSGNNISLHNWGEDTSNELIKKQIIIKALGAAKVKGAIPELEKLSKANCSNGQWRECISGPLSRTITAINSQQKRVEIEKAK